MDLNDKRIFNNEYLQILCENTYIKYILPKINI